MPVSGRRGLATSAVRGAGSYAAMRVRALARREGTVPPAQHLMHRFDSFLTWHDRPKGVELVRPVAGAPPLPPTAIVIQGGLMLESDFTVQTVRTYRAYYPDVHVIVSTWAGLDPLHVSALRDAGADVILSDQPANPGHGNLNLQLVSTQAGIARARALGATHVLKTRTDQRLYAPYALHLMVACMEAFPVGDRHGRQRARIVTSSLGTFKVVPYHISDMFNFGLIDDMEEYWSPPADPKTAAWVPLTTVRTPRNFTARDHCEIWILRHYLERLGVPAVVSLADWWRVLGERFVVLDESSVDLLWPKYTLREYRHRDYTYTSFFDEVHLCDWLLLARDPSLEGMIVPEDCLDREYPWPLGAEL